MGGLGNKRKSEERKKANLSKDKELSLNDSGYNSISQNQLAVLDLLEKGTATSIEISDALKWSTSKTNGVLSGSVRSGIVERFGHHHYRIGPNAPHASRVADGQARNAPLLDLIPHEGRTDLGHLSLRDTLQFWKVQFYFLAKQIRKPELLSMDAYWETVEKLLRVSDEIRKVARAEAEINPGLAIDGVNIYIPGLNMPALDRENKTVNAQEVKRRQEVWLSLVGAAVEEAKPKAQEG